MRTVPLGMLACSLAAFAGLPERSLADASPPVAAQAAGYDELIQQGLQEYELGHWPEAKVFFAHAHALRPNARTLRALGLTCYELRRYVDAIGFLQQALINPAQPLTEPMRAKVERVLGQATQFVSRVQVELQPRDAELSVDGTRAVLDASGAVLIDPGPHELAAKAAGFEPAARTLRAEGGNQLQLRLQLRRSESRASEPLASHAESGVARASRAGSGSMAAWILIGGSSALLITGGIFLGVAAGDKARAEHPDRDSTWRDVDRAYRQGKTFFPVGFALLGAGIAGVTAGLAWEFWPAETKPETAAALRLGPAALEFSASF